MYTCETRGTELTCTKSPRRWLLEEALVLEVECRGASEVYANDSVSRVDLAIGIGSFNLPWLYATLALANEDWV